MTAAEKAAVAKMFTETFVPAVNKWLDAYEGRIPFGQGDFTLDKFHSQFGKGFYTFLINGITLTIVETNGVAKVMYLMTGEAAKKLNTLPEREGGAPDLTLPITREDVIRMVKSDSGVQFKPNEVLIRPTGRGTALEGGAFVILVPTGGNPNNFFDCKIDLVFDSDGQIITYGRDPFF